MKFTKMHGLGNDYIYVNCFSEVVENPSAVARYVSDRHFGIGGDGMILIKPSETADFEMDMYNADGSRGSMCGNGIRCVAKYVYDMGLTDKEDISVSTPSGIKYLHVFPRDGRVEKVRVNMGTPKLKPREIPARFDEREIIGLPFTINGREFKITCVSMGNPHCVIQVEDVNHFPLEKIGKLFEESPIFPDRVNLEIIKVLDRHTVQMRVWERGSGETMACGTGACAVAVACVLGGLTERSVSVNLLGGDLDIEWNEEDGNVYMTGPASTVFTGEIEI